MGSRAMLRCENPGRLAPLGAYNARVISPRRLVSSGFSR